MPPVTVKSIEPLLLPLHETSTLVSETERADGSEMLISEIEVVQPLLSVTKT